MGHCPQERYQRGRRFAERAVRLRLLKTPVNVIFTTAKQFLQVKNRKLALQPVWCEWANFSVTLSSCDLMLAKKHLGI